MMKEDINLVAEKRSMSKESQHRDLFGNQSVSFSERNLKFVVNFSSTVLKTEERKHRFAVNDIFTLPGLFHLSGVVMLLDRLLCSKVRSG